MQVIKNGKLYDTDTAELILERPWGILYLTKKHHWFFMQKNPCIIYPTTKREVRKILEAGSDKKITEVLKKYFHYREA